VTLGIDELPIEDVLSVEELTDIVKRNIERQNGIPEGVLKGDNAYTKSLHRVRQASQPKD